MRRVLAAAAVPALLLALVPARADAVTVVPPGGGDTMVLGDPVFLSGTDKEAGTRINVQEGDDFTFCGPQPLLDAVGDWQCQMAGPYGQGTFRYSVVVTDANDVPVGDPIPFEFTIVSVLRLDSPHLDFDPADPIRVTGVADAMGELDAVVTKVGDRSFRLPLPCTVGDGNRFTCAEPGTRTAARSLSRAALPPGGDYMLTLTETDVEIGVVAQLVQEFSVDVADPPPPDEPEPEPDPPGTPTDDPTTPTDTPTDTPTTTPTGDPTDPVGDPTDGPLPPVSVDPPEVSTPVADPVGPLPGPDLSVLIGILIAAFVTLSIAGGRNFSGLRLVAAAGERRTPLVPVVPVVPSAGGDDNALDREVDHRPEARWGDRSFTWRLRGHRFADRVGLLPPQRIAPRSPLVGRLLADAGYLRAILGVLWTLPVAGAAVVAVLALADTGGRPVPPSTVLVAVVIALACLDALAGAVAIGVFWLGVLVSGGLGDGRLPDVPGSIAVLLVLGLLWMALPLIGSATRPFRRMLGSPGVYAWDRVADGAVAAALCGWVAYKLAQALSPFAGLELAISDDALAVGLVTAGGVGLRLALEEVAEHGYPLRLHQVEKPGSLPDPTRPVEVAGALLRTGALGLMAYVFLGSCWQLWVGMALVGTWQVAAAYDDKLPRSPLLGRLLPRGLVQILVMLLVCTVIANLVADGRVGLETVRDSFVIMAVPSSLLAGLALFAESPKPVRWNWPGQLLGAGVFAAIVVLVLLGW